MNACKIMLTSPEVDSCTNFELDSLAIELQIPNYVPAKIKDKLVNKTCLDNKCSIVNLENLDQTRIYCVLYFKQSNTKIDYSRFGDYPCQNILACFGSNEYTSNICV